MANFKDMRKQREAGKEFKQHKIIKKFLNSLPNPRSKNLYKSVLLKYFMFIDKNPDEYVKDIRKLENGARIDALDQYENDIISYWSKLMENYVPPGSISTRIGIIRVFFRDNNIQISSNIWAMIRKRGKGTRAVTKEIPVTQQMIKEILNHGNHKCKTLFLFLISSGMRIGETLKLLSSDIDFDSTPTKVNIRAETTKTNEERTTFISNEASRYLQEWQKAREEYLLMASKRVIHTYHGDVSKNPNDPRLFPYSDDGARDMFYGLLRKSGYDEKDSRTNRYKIHIHSLRKYFRSNFGRETSRGRDVAEILMGHKGYLNDSYVKLSEEQLKKEYIASEKFVTVFDIPIPNTEQKHVIKKMQNEMDNMHEMLKSVTDSIGLELDDRLAKKKALQNEDTTEQTFKMKKRI